VNKTIILHNTRYILHRFTLDPEYTKRISLSRHLLVSLTVQELVCLTWIDLPKVTMEKTTDAISANLWPILVLINMSAINYGYVLVGLNACLAVGNRGDPTACFNGDDDWNPPCPEGSIYDDMNLSTANAQVATSLVALGAWVGCLSGYTPLEKYGRKKTLLWNNAFFIAGAIASACGNEPLLYIGRLLSGFAVGVTSAVCPMMSAEIALESQRGTVTGLFPVFARFGMFLTALVGYGFVKNVEHGWQYVMAMSMIPSLIQIGKWRCWDCYCFLACGALLVGYRCCSMPRI
jgi:MFS family permease